jgi:hypothetical protein
MLALPIGSLVVGAIKGELNNTDGFLFGFFCASLIALVIYAQGPDSGLTWLQAYVLGTSRLIFHRRSYFSRNLLFGWKKE